MAADNGHISAAYQMHILYHYRYIDMNVAENVKYLKIAADGGIAEAAYKLGGWYHQGCYVEKDENKSFEWYNEAAKLGSAAALKALKRLGLDAETRKHIEELAKSAAANNLESKLEYAKRLMAGKGVQKDEVKAKTMFFEMSQQGLPEAIRIYEAIQLIEKRQKLEQNQNNGDNIFELARMYHEGYPSDRIPLESYEQHYFLTKDIEKAIGLYKKAILMGNTLSEKYYTWAMQEYILEKIKDIEETIGSLQISIDELSANDNFNDEI
jgi:TPR repeat protein